MAAARASFSSDSSRIVNKIMPDSSILLLKDHLLDDLSSCSSNGFRSYPRRQFCTKVRYLIQIDLINSRHIKLPPTQHYTKSSASLKSSNKSKSKSKKAINNISSSSSVVLHKASNAVVNVFKKFQFLASRKTKKAKAASSINLPRNISGKKLSKHSGSWKKTSDDEHKKKFERFEEYSIKQQKKKKKKKHNSPSKVSVTTTADIIKSTSIMSNNNSNSFVSSDHSYFTTTDATSDSSSTTIGGSSNINAAHDVVQNYQKQTTTVKMNFGQKVAVVTTDTTANGSNAQKEQPSMEKDQFSPVSVLDFPFNNDDDNYDEDEVTSPFRRGKLYVKGSKQKLTQRTKSLAQLKPVRLEDRITLDECRTHDSISVLSLQSKSECELEDYEMENKAIALLQLLKATMHSRRHLFESTTMTESILLGFFAQRIMEGNVSNYTILQEAKDWINDQTKEMFETQDYKLAYIRDMEKGAKWFKYDEEVETQDVGMELECEVFTSLVEEMLHDFYL